MVAHLHQPGCYHIALSPDNQYLLTEGQECKLWSLRAGDLVKVFSNCMSGTFTNDSKYMLLISERKKVLYFDLTTMVTQFTPLKRLFSPIALEPIHNKPDLVLLTTQASGNGRKYSKVEVWDFQKGYRIHKFDNVSPSGMKDLSKDGHIAVDGYLQVYDLDIGAVVINQSGSNNTELKHVKVTDDGHYIVWADTRPADCLKVMCRSDGRIVAEVSTHSKVVSLNLADHGYFVTAGCEDGHFLTYRLHKVSELDDENEEVIQLDFNVPDVLNHHFQKGPASTVSDERSRSKTEEKIRSRSRAGSIPEIDTSKLKHHKSKSKSKMNIFEIFTCSENKLPRRISDTVPYLRSNSKSNLAEGKGNDSEPLLIKVRSESTASLAMEKSDIPTELPISKGNTFNRRRAMIKRSPLQRQRSRSHSPIRRARALTEPGESPAVVGMTRYTSNPKLESSGESEKGETGNKNDCVISEEDLHKLDVLYHWMPVDLEDKDLPSVGPKVKEALESGAKISFSTDFDNQEYDDPRKEEKCTFM